tara:strand:- start:1414 stop:2061 length:648 start_codon:yes stop_codon:yes gene_type:complete
MTKTTKQAYKPTPEIKTAIANIIKLGKAAAKAELVATQKNTAFIVTFWEALQGIDEKARKYVINSVLATLQPSTAKWVKALINKLLKDDGQLQKWLKGNPNKSASDFITDNKLGEKGNAQKFQTRRRGAGHQAPKNGATSPTKPAIELEPVDEIVEVGEELSNMIFEKLGYIADAKRAEAVAEFIRILTVAHYATEAMETLPKVKLIKANANATK